jgi:hypothetical protein
MEIDLDSIKKIALLLAGSSTEELDLGKSIISYYILTK